MNHTSLRQHWRSLKQFLTVAAMTPQEFLALHPELSRDQLAEIVGCHVDTVHCWFAAGAHHRDPNLTQKKLLGVAHWYLVQRQAAPTLFGELEEMSDRTDN
jgi:hypothetical protein